jgi:galactokinase
LPQGVLIAGWLSGVEHAVGGSAYAQARAAAFAGKRMFESHLGRAWAYAAEIPPSLFHRHVDAALPSVVQGERFLDEFSDVDDPRSVIEPEREYRVRDSLRFPIEENFRCELAESLLCSASGRRRGEHLRQIGELMAQSHAGYSSIGLGVPETDAMVEALREAGPDLGIYGGRVSGGGSGGAVVVLLEKSALGRLEELVNRVKFNATGTTLILGKEKTASP